MKEFGINNLETDEQHNVNSIVLSLASDNAEKLTDLECELNDITCYVIEIEGGVEVQSYTEEAQDIFNIHYDDQVDELYNFLNQALKIIK